MAVGQRVFQQSLIRPGGRLTPTFGGTTLPAAGSVNSAPPVFAPAPRLDTTPQSFGIPFGGDVFQRFGSISPAPSPAGIPFGGGQAPGALPRRLDPGALGDVLRQFQPKTPDELTPEQAARADIQAARGDIQALRPGVRAARRGTRTARRVFRKARRDVRQARRTARRVRRSGGDTTASVGVLGEAKAARKAAKQDLRGRRKVRRVAARRLTRAQNRRAAARQRLDKILNPPPLVTADGLLTPETTQVTGGGFQTPKKPRRRRVKRRKR